jgi:hypothetical protein
MKKIVLILVCLSALFFTACKKELSDNFTTYPNHPLNDTVWLRNLTNAAAINDLFDLLLPSGVLIDSFNTAAGATLRFGDSVEISFAPGSCITPGSGGSTPGGTPSGNSKLLVLPLKRKGDFIRFFTPTTTANGSILETGGGLFIRVMKEGQELVLAPGTTVKVKFNDVDSVKQNMQTFYGQESKPVPPKGIDTAFSWVRDFDTSYLKTWFKPSNNPLVPSYNGYEINSKNLRWITADRYIDSTQLKTKITAILSPNFTNKNTAVFAVFNNQKTVVNLKGDYPSRSFFANIPLKSNIKLVSLSKIGADFFLGIENVNSVSTVTSHTIKPEKKSLVDILKFINSL